MQWYNLARRVRAWTGIPRQAIRDVRVHRAAKGYGLAPLPVRIAEQIALLAVSGIEAEDYYHNGLANLVRGFPRKSRFLGAFQNWRWLAVMNPARPTTADKLKFHAHLVEHGLPAPALYAYVSERETPATVTQSSSPHRLPGGTLLVNLEAFLVWLSREKLEDFFIKPVDGQNGRGVLSLGRLASAAPKWHEIPSGRQLGLSEIKAHMQGIGRSFLVQERLAPHERLSCFSNSILQTARIVTIRLNDAVHVVGAAFKIANGEYPFDNLVGGRNAIASIDVQTGRLGRGFMLKNGLVPFESDIHPMTGARISGTVLPCWSEAVEITLKLARTFPAPQYLGWDIGLTTRGAVIIEGNARPAPMLLQLPHGRGLLEDETVCRLLLKSGRFHGHISTAQFRRQH